MKTKVAIVICSHLSDVQQYPLDELANDRLNFVKWLVNEYPNTDVDIDADVEWDRFQAFMDSRKAGG